MTSTCPAIVPLGNVTGQYSVSLANIEFIHDDALSFLCIGSIISKRYYSQVAVGNCYPGNAPTSWYRLIDLVYCRDFFYFPIDLSSLESYCGAVSQEDVQGNIKYTGSVTFMTSDVVTLDYLNCKLIRVLFIEV